MKRKPEDMMIQDNLSLITWLVEKKTKESVNTLNPCSTKDGNVEMVLSDDSELSLDRKVVIRTIKPLIDLAAEVYNCDTKCLEIEKDKVVLRGFPEKTVDIKDFEREMRDKLVVKFELECNINGIGYSGLNKLYGASILDVLDVYNELNSCIRTYCHGGKPIMPVKFVIDLNSHGNLLSNIYAPRRTF